MVVGSVCDLVALEYAARGCDYIIHTAAQPAMTIALDVPAIDCDVNVRGTVNVLETAKRLNVPVVNCSSIHVYGNDINVDLEYDDNRFHRYPSEIAETEPMLLGEVTPLHASKMAAELYVRAYIDSYDVMAANFRLTGMYGPRQFGGMDHGWVANFAIRTVTGMPITIYGTDKQVRDILFVEDAARAFEKFYEKPQAGTYNIGGGYATAISIKECLAKLAVITGKEQAIQMKPERKGDLHYFVCNVNKAVAAFNWQPHVLPDEGLCHLVAWVNENVHIFTARVAA